jgi:RimJ/RimL family protein N-acetyltransferase
MILLERFNQKDIGELLGWLKDTDAEFLMQFAGPRYKFPLDEGQLMGTLADKNGMAFRVTESGTGTALGHCQLLRIDPVNGTATIGRVLIRPEQRGHGHGHATVEQLLGFAKNALGLKRVDLRVFDFNRSACHCCEKLGFVEVRKEAVAFPQINKTWNSISMEYSLE